MYRIFVRKCWLRVLLLKNVCTGRMEYALCLRRVHSPLVLVPV